MISDCEFSMEGSDDFEEESSSEMCSSTCFLHCRTVFIKKDELVVTEKDPKTFYLYFLFRIIANMALCSAFSMLVSNKTTNIV